LPEIGSANRRSSRHREQLAKLFCEQGIALECPQDSASARGTSSAGKITLLSGQFPAEEFAPLAHGVGHEVMRWSQRRSNMSSKGVRKTDTVTFGVCGHRLTEKMYLYQDFFLHFRFSGPL